MPILNTPDKVQAERIARACLDHKAVYVCTLGSSCEMLHDWIDQTDVMDKVDAEMKGLPPKGDTLVLRTTWHNDFDEGVWFALVAANVDHAQIDTIVCIDMSPKGEADRLISLVNAIEQGWLPPDTD